LNASLLKVIEEVEVMHRAKYGRENQSGLSVAIEFNLSAKIAEPFPEEFLSEFFKVGFQQISRHGLRLSKTVHPKKQQLADLVVYA